MACFETLCGVRSVAKLLEILPSICTSEEAKYIDDHCDWSHAKHWAQWWTRASQNLSKAFSDMSPDSWRKCPSTTNAVERKNKDCKTDNVQPLKLAITSVYKLDKVQCFKHMAAEEGASVSYRSQTDEARKCRATARQKQRMKAVNPDKINVLYMVLQIDHLTSIRVSVKPPVIVLQQKFPRR